MKVERAVEGRAPGPVSTALAAKSPAYLAFYAMACVYEANFTSRILYKREPVVTASIGRALPWPEY